MTPIQLAKVVMRTAHDAVGQVRKFSGLPYWTHPEAVALLLQKYVPDATEDMIVAALLHDVDEDTKAGHLIPAFFGLRPAQYVRGLTNKKIPGLNRAQQKQFDARRIAGECWEVKVIKLCDRLHNLPDIIENDPSHAKVYVPETRYLLDVGLIGVHDKLWNELDAIVKKYYENACVPA